MPFTDYNERVDSNTDLVGSNLKVLQATDILKYYLRAIVDLFSRENPYTERTFSSIYSVNITREAIDITDSFDNKYPRPIPDYPMPAPNLNALHLYNKSSPNINVDNRFPGVVVTLLRDKAIDPTKTSGTTTITSNDIADIFQQGYFPSSADTSFIIKAAGALRIKTFPDRIIRIEPRTAPNYHVKLTNKTNRIIMFIEYPGNRSFSLNNLRFGMTIEAYSGSNDDYDNSDSNYDFRSITHDGDILLHPRNRYYPFFFSLNTGWDGQGARASIPSVIHLADVNFNTLHGRAGYKIDGTNKVLRFREPGNSRVLRSIIAFIWERE